MSTPTSPLQRAQQAVAPLLGISSPEDVQLMASSTDTLSQAILNFHWKPGDGIVISAIEPTSILRAVRKMAREHGLQFYIVPYTDAVPFDTNTLETLLQTYPNVRLVVVPHASHVIGSILPIETIGALTQQYHTLFWLDITDTMGRLPINTHALNANLIVGRGNQTFSIPENTEIIYADGRRPPNQVPLTAEQLDLITKSACQSQTIGLTEIREQESLMLAYLLDGLLAIPEVIVYGHTDIEQRIPVVSFNVLNQYAHTVAEQLPRLNQLTIEAGFHGSPMAHEAIGTLHRDGTIRVELNYRTSFEAINTLLSALKNSIYSAERRPRNQQPNLSPY